MFFDLLLSKKNNTAVIKIHAHTYLWGSDHLLPYVGGLCTFMNTVYYQHGFIVEYRGVAQQLQNFLFGACGDQYKVELWLSKLNRRKPFLHRFFVFDIFGRKPKAFAFEVGNTLKKYIDSFVLLRSLGIKTFGNEPIYERGVHTMVVGSGEQKSNVF